ncbi:hypothetical protein [Candidatus Thiodictyon syntrophicum]|jgi:hypothetical protein|uniref:Uncharacterized protein n=1 Tax=Candidatus Thiodictyon syntrophicum TaxID=1166950 RepID=A0A2K8U3C2_9GAMM|nr:hypothetical protein [Candidatus Thiodictyon syntrophicum]AUB80047.1 hypothetical protein THSYN_03090 [Candidatus Thiodictyon syntrophicum]
MTVATVAEAPVFAVLRTLKAELSEEQYSIVKRGLVNASLALARRYWSMHNSHDIELACKVAAAVISLGMREKALLSGREPFYKKHPAPIKALFQVGWSRLGENVVAPSNREDADAAETPTTKAGLPPENKEAPVKRFLAEICTIPGAPWPIDTILHHEEMSRNERERLASFDRIRDRLAPIDKDPDNDYSAPDADGYKSEKDFFLQVIAFGEPKRKLPKEEILRLELSESRETWDARVATFLTKFLANNNDELRLVSECWSRINKDAFSASVREVVDALRNARAQGELSEITAQLKIEVPYDVAKCIEQVEQDFEGFHDAFVEELAEKASSLKKREEIYTFFYCRKADLLLHAPHREYEKILKFDDGKPRYRKWLERYTKELRKYVSDAGSGNV